MAKKRNNNDLSSPRSRTERYLAKIAGLNDSMPASPFSRLERYLEAIALRSAGVGSFNGRTGAVVPESGDYTAQMVGAVPIYGKGHNLLDNAYFGDVDAIIDQRGGYVLTDTATYYTDTALTQNPVTVSAYTTVYYPDVHSVYVGFYLTDDPTGTEYYASRTDCVRGYTGAGYAIDRWKLSTSNTMIINADSIKLGVDTEHRNTVIRQYLKNYYYLYTRILTISVLTTGGLFTVTGQLSIVSGAYQSPVITFGNGWYANVTGTVNKSELYFRFWNTTTTNPLEVIATGLEPGDTQTCFTNLGTDQSPNWVPSSMPDYDLELYKCQRYQFKSSANQYRKPYQAFMYAYSNKILVGTLAFPTTMRINPRITTAWCYDVNGNYVNINGAEFVTTRDGLTLIRAIPNDPLTSGSWYQVGVFADANL